MKRNVAIVLFDGIEVLDFAGPFEVFSAADELSASEAFNVYTLAQTTGPVRTNHGLIVVPSFTLANAPKPDVLIIPGGVGTRPLLMDSVFIEWIRAQSSTAEVVMSVCTGALLLAKAGLLDGLAATTHHDLFDLLEEMAPLALVMPRERFTDNGKICTAAGVSAGIDLSLHLVGRFLGATASEETAHYIEYDRH